MLASNLADKCPAVFEVGQEIPIGETITDLLLIATCSLDGEYNGRSAIFHSDDAGKLRPEDFGPALVNPCPAGGWLAVEVDPGILPIVIETMRVQKIRRTYPEAHVRSAPGAEGCGHGGNPRFARTSQRHADGKVLRAPGAE